MEYQNCIFAECQKRTWEMATGKYFASCADCRFKNTPTGKVETMKPKVID